MNKEEYAKLVKKYTPNEDKLKHALIAFAVGGIIGILACFIYNILMKFDISTKDANIWTLLIIIATSSLFTGFGFFDNWVSKAKAGLIVPITGFAHAMTSSMIDYKKEGLVTGIGANAFKLTGSVILYGVVSAYLFGMVRYLFFGG